MASGMDKQNAFQNAFQNTPQLQSFHFNYNEIGNQSATYLILFLALILLAALIRSESRYRALLAQMPAKPE